jgi:hypothetical protein
MNEWNGNKKVASRIKEKERSEKREKIYEFYFFLYTDYN